METVLQIYILMVTFASVGPMVPFLFFFFFPLFFLLCVESACILALFPWFPPNNNKNKIYTKLFSCTQIGLKVWGREGVLHYSNKHSLTSSGVNYLWS